jgi:peptide deformylase
MIIRNTTQIGNPIIRRKSKIVKNIKSKIVQKTIKDLVDSMRHHGLIGMAAPQIGKNLRIFVTEIRQTPTRKPKDLDPVRVFINPKIKNLSKKKISGYEGCGSVGQPAALFGEVLRSESLEVSATSEKGDNFKLKTKGLLARVIQHEYDHLEGLVFLDHISNPKTLISRSEYFKNKK